jgi:hypothetical protein
MRLVTSLMLYLAAVSGAQAQAARLDRIEIFEAGIYNLEIVKKIDDPTQASGARSTVTNTVLAQKTTQIPAKLGVRFGLRYRLVGAPADEVVEIKKITRFPPEGMRNPNTRETTFRNELMLSRRIGAESYTGYGFDQDFELVPGVWTIELWSGDRKLASQSFTVKKP